MPNDIDSIVCLEITFNVIAYNFENTLGIFNFVIILSLDSDTF